MTDEKMPLPFLNASYVALAAEAQRERNPSGAFLDSFGFEDAVIVSRWIREVGAERFSELVAAFSEPDAGGRPKANYARFIDEYNDVKKRSPGLKNYEIAAKVAKQAYAKKDWRGFRPPATESAFADTLIRQAEQRSNRKGQPGTGKKPNAQNSLAIRERVKKRASALDEVATLFVATDDQGKALKKTLDQIATPNGARMLEEACREVIATNPELVARAKNRLVGLVDFLRKRGPVKPASCSD